MNSNLLIFAILTIAQRFFCVLLTVSVDEYKTLRKGVCNMSNENCREGQVLKALSAPFNPKDIEWRVQSATRKNNQVSLLVLAYLDARAIQERLDEVMGVNWQTEYFQIQVGQKEAFQCKLSLKVDGEWISRTDGAEASDIESVKGGHSNALKRAAVQWGIGRYLYNLDSVWVPLTANKQSPDSKRVYGKFKINGKQETLSGYYTPPILPEWALPAGFKGKQQTSGQASVNTPSGNPGGSKPTNNQASNKPLNQKEQGASQQSKNNALEFVKNTINALQIPPEYIKPLFKRATGADCAINEAEYDQLNNFFRILRPVHEYVKGCKKFGLSDEQMIWFAQLVLKTEIKSIHSLYFKMGKEEATQALLLAKDEAKIA